jgi:hypothetical protein
LKNPSQKRAGGVTQGIGLEFKPQYHKEKTKQNNYSKGWGYGSSGRVPAIVSTRPRIQTPVLAKPKHKTTMN